VARRHNRMVSTQWPGTVALGARPTSVEKSDPVKSMVGPQRALSLWDMMMMMMIYLHA